MRGHEMCQVPFLSHPFPASEEAFSCFCSPTSTLTNGSSARTTSEGVDNTASTHQQPQAGAGEQVCKAKGGLTSMLSLKRKPTVYDVPMYLLQHAMLLEKGEVDVIAARTERGW